MLICYLDEAGNTGRRLDDPDQPRHFVVAVMVREDRVREMTDRLDELAARVPLRVPLVEYHGYDLFHGEGVWEGLYPRQRIDEYEKAISVLGEVRADIAYASINKPALAEKSYANPNPHTFALQFLVEKIERWLRGRPDELSQRALLVADQNHEQEQYSFDLIREMQATGGLVGAGYGLNLTLDHIVDNVYFDRSDRNRGIQLADLVAFLLHRAAKTRRQPGDPRSDDAIRKLRQQLCPHCATWREPWPPG